MAEDIKTTCSGGCSGCRHGKPMYRMARTENYERVYDFFRKNGLKPFGLTADGESDGYNIVTVWELTSFQSQRSCPAGMTAPDGAEAAPDEPTVSLCGGIALCEKDGEHYIGGIALGEAERDKHLGSTLIKKLIDEVNKLGGHTIYAIAPLAPAFYQKFGFDWDPSGENRLVLHL